MNFLNINQTLPLCTDPGMLGRCPCPTDADLRAAIDTVHALGGLVIVNHIAWSNGTERLLPGGGCAHAGMGEWGGADRQCQQKGRRATCQSPPA